jgi:hypothetical protein
MRFNRAECAPGKSKSHFEMTNVAAVLHERRNMNCCSCGGGHRPPLQQLMAGHFLKFPVCRFAAGMGFFNKAMSEFKFACPVCGQHIVSDPGMSGAQIECPTCFQKIIVPQPPAPGSKFILSATQPIKPRHVPSTLLQRDTPQTAPRKRISPATFVMLLLICTAGAGIFIVSRKNSNSQNTPAVWTLNLAGAAFPGWNAGGKIHGRAFVCDRAILQGATLILRQGTNQPADLALNVALPPEQGGEWSRKSLNILPDQTNGTPRVTLRWRDGQQQVNEPFANGYAMKLEFGQAAGGRMPGKIYLCLPDVSQSCVAGTFNAEIRKPRQPQPGVR